MKSVNCADVCMGDTHGQIACPLQRNDAHALLLSSRAVPVFYPTLDVGKLPLHSGQTRIVPQPKGRDAHYGIEPGAESERIEGVDQATVDLLDDLPKIVLGDLRVEDLGIEVGVGRGQVALDHPIALDANDAGAVVQGRVERDVGIRVREARVGGAPGKFGGVVVGVGVLVGLHGIGPRRQGGAGGLLGYGSARLEVGSAGWCWRCSGKRWAVCRDGLLVQRHARRWRLGFDVVREADARALAAVTACGTFDSERRRRYWALAAQTLLGKGQQRVLVARIQLRVLHWQIGPVAGVGAWRRRWLVVVVVVVVVVQLRVLLVMLATLLLLLLHGRVRRIDGVPEARRGLAGRRRVQRAEPKQTRYGPACWRRCGRAAVGRRREAW